MLDIKQLRETIDEVAAKLKTRHYELDTNTFWALEQQRKTLQTETQKLQEERNSRSKEIGIVKQQGKDISDILRGVEQSNNALKEKEQELKQLQDKIQQFVSGIPNLPHESVPVGNDESDNLLVSTWGEPTKLGFEPKDHIQLIEDKRWFNNDEAVKISGSRFAVLRGDLASLHRAIAQFMMDTHTQQNGYEEVNVPTIVNQNSLFGTGQLPKFEEDIFHIQKKTTGGGETAQGAAEALNFYMIPTAEVPLTNLVANSIVPSQDLPLKFVAHSCCYRSEAGSYGRDIRGLIRQHQFEKVELVHVVDATSSFDALEELTDNAEGILQALELPYRKVILCTGDMGFSACKTYDLEVWLPAQNTYREISSCSNTLDFQARRMQARYKSTQDKKAQYLHTLNGSGLAVGRTLVAILENNQMKNGNIRIPAALQKYMAGRQEI